MRVEIYSDVVCPWCYIGERRFARALEAFGRKEEVEVVFRAYQLDPGASETAVPLLDYLRGRFGQNTSGMLSQVSLAAEGEGIDIDWESAQSVNTRTAHRLLALADREYGSEVQRALMEELFELHFTRGGDLADEAALTELGGSVGMDRERLGAFLRSDEGAQEVDAEIARARELGIRAVPTFVFDGLYGVQGAQPTSVFLQTLEEVEAKVIAAASVHGSGESCNDGACEM